MAYESEDELKRLQMRNSGGIDGTSTVQSDYANGSAAPMAPVRTGGYGENDQSGSYSLVGGEPPSGFDSIFSRKNPDTKMKSSSPKKAAPKKYVPTAKSADEARGAYKKRTAKSPDEARGRDVGYNTKPSRSRQITEAAKKSGRTH